MRRIAVTLTLVAILCIRGSLRADDLLTSYFSDYLDALRAQAGIPGLAAAIVNVDETRWERGYGVQNVEHGDAATSITPFHVDGLTQIVTASVLLRCMEDGRLSLDDKIGQFKGSKTDANATIREVLTHTSGPADNLTFQYRPQRLDSLAPVVRACTNDSFRENVSNMLDRLAMADSVPGPDATHLEPPAEGIPSADAVKRYTAVLDHLATPYAVNAQRRALPSNYTVTTLTPSAGLISTVHDYVNFDLALRDGLIIQRDTLAGAWTPPVDKNGAALPHGLGWFVQSYNGKKLVWQFGIDENAASSLVLMVPSKGITLILMANSDRLAKPFDLSAGDVTVSPFARVFLGIFAR